MDDYVGIENFETASVLMVLDKCSGNSSHFSMLLPQILGKNSKFGVTEFYIIIL